MALALDDLRLRSHPARPGGGVGPVGLRGRVAPITTLQYSVSGDDIRWPEPGPGGRTDGLWRTTCFELFVRPAGHRRYFEFNFSPSTAWAAYGFDDYRAGMRDIAMPPPMIERTADGIRVTADLSGLPPPPWHVGLSAVIEAAGGSLSYQALAHPPAKPDFHDPACFEAGLARTRAA